MRIPQQSRAHWIQDKINPLILDNHNNNISHIYIKLILQEYGRGRGRCRGFGNKPQCQLCRKFRHLVHICFQRFNVHFQGVTTQSADRNENLTASNWNGEEDIQYIGHSVVQSVQLFQPNPSPIPAALSTHVYPPVYNPYLPNPFPYYLSAYMPSYSN